MPLEERKNANMSSRVHPYKGATVVAQYVGPIPTGQFQGETATITLFRDYASTGFRSNYERVPTAWLELRTSGGFRQCWRYSGKRLELAQKHYDKNVSELVAAQGATDAALTTHPARGENGAR